MKLLYGFFIVIIFIISFCQVGSAERLYRWVDSDGVTHLTQEPPPEDGKLIEEMKYADPKDMPVDKKQAESKGSSAKQSEQQIVEKSPEAEAQSRPKTNPAATCYILPVLEDIYVYVTEYPDPDQVVEKVLYKGNIQKSRQHLIKSSQGRIKYSYQLSSDDRTYGDNEASCVDGDVISIP